ncbi:MAG TPA: dihydrofolate reductase family protein [Candidatus Lokiarchaeia archaeon]|nr:dihydrofolate reductase family protein [Candidatus Lokiarchaeia archaeon]
MPGALVFLFRNISTIIRDVIVRTLFLFMMTSVDGYFETGQHGLDWHNVDDEFVTFTHEQLGEVDTILFGRKTYEMMASFWPKPEGIAGDPITATFMTEIPKIVFSHEPFTPEWDNTTVITEGTISTIRALKNQEGKEIAIFGSNELCVSLMPSKIIDEFRIMVSPIALGAGNSLFTGLSDRVKLKLVKAREFVSGNILLCYTPA